MSVHCWQSVILTAALASVCCAQSLRQAADRDGLLIGTAVRPSQLSEAAYASTLAREFNKVEAEDAMKWWVLRPDRASYDFRQGDEVIRFAEAHQMKGRGHCPGLEPLQSGLADTRPIHPAATVAASARTHYPRDEALSRTSLRVGCGERGAG